VAGPAQRVDVVAITGHDEISDAPAAHRCVDVVVSGEIRALNGHLVGLYLHERIPATRGRKVPFSPGDRPPAPLHSGLE
jgi:hypothetical protein